MEAAMWKAPEPCNLKKVLEDEQKAIAARRNKLDLPKPGDDLMGIALSGGGIRSATVCLGVLEVLNENRLLEKADYLSSVSGGGYTASYVHATLQKHASTRDAYKKLFAPDEIGHLRDYGSYLAPGSKWCCKFFNYCKLAGAYAYSFFMNLVWVLSLFVTVGAIINCLFNWMNSGLEKGYSETYSGTLLCVAIFIFAVHFFLHALRMCGCWSSRILYKLEGIIFSFGLIYAAHRLFAAYVNADGVFTRILKSCLCTIDIGNRPHSLLSGPCSVTALAFFTILVVTGFFANPNLLTFHRFYRDSLAAAYLFLIKGVDRAFKLYRLNPGSSPEEWGAAPYPLINTCLNLLGKSDQKFAGTRTCEHFLLSPLYCGSKLTGYASSDGSAYKSMTVATAMAISGAAVNPDMGYKTNRFLAFAMTVLNLRLGYWAPNPASRILPLLTWWPWYHISELISETNTRKRRVLLSDGGHIENLAVFELLRRRCRLIIAVDAGADPTYEFADLQELIIQARNILGVEIKFRVKPEEIIRPAPSYGYSQEHYAIADLSDLPGAETTPMKSWGILIYLKASLKAPKTTKTSDTPSYLYKTYHTAFPHEPTSDQFFDEPQWDAYYTLGKRMAKDMLQSVLGKEPEPASSCARAATDLYQLLARKQEQEAKTTI